MPLPLPVTDNQSLVDIIVAERVQEPNKTFFKSIAAEWKQRVGEYINLHGSPEHVPTWLEIMDNAKSFKNLYSHPTDGSAQGVMLNNLRSHDLDICPACGSPATPETLDHYLPKGRYPHFAVTPVNLTPMCDPCQRRKKEKTGDKNSPRFFIHPYFDTFSIEQIVKLTINPPFTKPTFTLTPHPNLQANEVALVTTHLRELQIARRYIKFFRNEHIRLLKNTSKVRSNGSNIITNIENWQDGHAHPTKNSWHYLFYDAVTRNLDFLDYLANGELPPNL